MMVPRSYHYQRRLSDSLQYDEKATSKPHKPKSTPSPKKMMLNSRKTEQRTPAPTSHPSVELSHSQLNTEPVHSKPVVIPQPAAHVQHGSTASLTQNSRTRGHRGSRHSRLPKDHKKDAVPPTVAALLAVTAIPPRPHTTRRRRGGQTDRRISIDELLQEWKQDEKDLSPSGYGSPMDILMEGPDDCSNDDASIVEPSSERDQDIVSIRTLSSDSLPSMPSLETDERSYGSWTSLATPSYSRKKVISSPLKEDCILDHPLLHFSLDDCSDTEDEPSIVITPSTRTPPPKVQSSFKSNLTASIQALKQAARSFSNFTAPTIPPDDLLTRSLLSPRFTSEMRPRQFQGLPTPALRRYLNPQRTPAPPISPTELFHDTLFLQDWSSTSTSASPMIQLQTYSKSRRNSLPSLPRRQQQSSSSEAGRVLSTGSGSGSGPSMRQREPRENSDFLRVIVLEMNMRREGKLDAKALGKARIWLPPRKLEAVEVMMPGCGDVPARWVAVAADDA